MPWQYGQFTARDLRYFAVAQSLAAVSTHHKAKIGSVIVQGSEVIAAAHNMEKSHPMQAKYNVHRYLRGGTHTHHLHAEIGALVRLKVPGEAVGARIYVSRLKNGKIGMCRPCNACLQALEDFGIYNIFYTTDFGFAYELIVKDQ